MHQMPQIPLGSLQRSPDSLGGLLLREGREERGEKGSGWKGWEWERRGEKEQ